MFHNTNERIEILGAIKGSQWVFISMGALSFTGLYRMVNSALRLQGIYLDNKLKEAEIRKLGLEGDVLELEKWEKTRDREKKIEAKKIANEFYEGDNEQLVLMLKMWTRRYIWLTTLLIKGMRLQ